MPTAVAERETKRLERVEASFMGIRDHCIYTLETLPSLRPIAQWKAEQFGYQGVSLDLFVDALMQKLKTYAEERAMSLALVQREKEVLQATAPAKKPRSTRPYVEYFVSILHEIGEGYMLANLLARDAREARKLVIEDAIAMGYTDYKIRMVSRRQVKPGEIRYF